MKSMHATMVSLLKRSNLLLILFGCVSLIIFSWSLRAHSSTDIPWFLRLVLIESVLFIAASWVTLRAQAKRSTLLSVISLACALSVTHDAARNKIGRAHVSTPVTERC